MDNAEHPAALGHEAASARLPAAVARRRGRAHARRINTVELAGAGFEPHAAESDDVAAGDVMFTWAR